MTVLSSTAGYDSNAEALVKQYESSPFEEVYDKIMHLFPSKPAHILDIGSGSGRDAAFLSQHGHFVVAVEPAKEMRERAQAIHSDVCVTWVDDSLPGLNLLQGKLAGPYDFILCAAVWMHFEEQEREASMKRVSELLVPDGRFLLSLRHGPIPAGRKMFSVTVQETILVAVRNGLTLTEQFTRPDHRGRADVSWTFVCLDKTAA